MFADPVKGIHKFHRCLMGIVWKIAEVGNGDW